MPIAATTQRVAAVVSPRTDRPWRMIAPAPRKPMPVTTWAAIRVGSKPTPLAFENCQSVQANAETSVNRAAPTETSMCVRSPASRSRSSRSKPIAPPSTAASPTRKRISSQLSSGNGRLHGVTLRFQDLLDSKRREVEHLVELIPREPLALGRRLHLDQASVPAQDDVDVDLRARVLRVVEVEQGLAVHEPDRHGGNEVGQRPAEPQAVEGPPCCDVRPGDGSTPRAAVGLEHVTVEPQRPLAQRLQVGYGPKRAPDQALDLHGAALLTPRAGLALR